MNDLDASVRAVLDPGGLALQTALMLAAVAVGFVLRGAWNWAVERRISAADEGSPRGLALRASKRVVFSLTLVIGAGLGYGLCNALGQPTGLLVALTLLLLAGCAGRPLMPTPNLYAAGAREPFARTPPGSRSTRMDLLYFKDRAPQPDE